MTMRRAVYRTLVPLWNRISSTTHAVPSISTPGSLAAEMGMISHLAAPVTPSVSSLSVPACHVEKSSLSSFEVAQHRVSG